MAKKTQLVECEARYRTVTALLSEALWRVELSKPVALDAPVAVQVEHILQRGFLAECNTVMARLLGERDADGAVGGAIKALLPGLGKPFFEDFVRAGYQLDHYALAMRLEEGPARRFFVNAVGSVDRGHLRHIWCSGTDVTDRVEMERRIVTMLEEQQARIGRDLHDSIGQLLTGIRMLSTNLTARHFKKTDEGFELAGKVTRFAEEASQRLHDILRGLTPPLLHQEDLFVTLEDLASHVDAMSEDIACTFVHDGQVAIDAHETRLQLYRIAQEATNNALKHAGAGHVWITLKREGTHVVLQIRDDGTGFDPEKQKRKSFGMSNMQHRAHSIGAALVIDSEVGAGTIITCSLLHGDPQ